MRQPPHRGHSPSVARARHRPRGQAAQRGGQPIAASCPRCRGRGGVPASRLRRYPTYRSPSCALGRGSPPQSTEYRFYLTNIDPDSLDAQCVAQTSAARWQIELIFKELKSHYRLDELPTSKAHIVETLLLGAVITLLVSRRLLQAVRERLTRTAYRCPSSVGLHCLLEPQRRSLTSLCCRRGGRESLPGASNRCCFMRRLTQIGRAVSSSSASNPAPLGLDSMHFNPLTDHQCAACTLCVYASQPGSLPDHATRDSGWWPALTGQGFHLLGRVEGFHHVCPSTWLPPSPSFAWRNQIWCTSGCSCGGSAVLDELYSVVEL